jgi:hypothetical protein
MTIENGKVIDTRKVRDNELYCDDGHRFSMAQEAGYQVIAPQTEDAVALTAIRIPERVHLQALQVLLRYRRRRIFPRRMRRTGYLSLKVNPRWRLLSKDDGRNWEVMSHETYNREKDK